jgi:hypothetical protein
MDIPIPHLRFQNEKGGNMRRGGKKSSPAVVTSTRCPLHLSLSFLYFSLSFQLSCSHSLARHHPQYCIKVLALEPPLSSIVPNKSFVLSFCLPPPSLPRLRASARALSHTRALSPPPCIHTPLELPLSHLGRVAEKVGSTLLRRAELAVRALDRTAATPRASEKKTSTYLNP